MLNENQNLSGKCRQNTRNLAFWTAAWVLTMALVSFGHKLLWNENQWISLSVIVVNTLIGIGMILANKKYLLGLDELQRKIHLEAMGITLGIVLVAGLSYSMLDVTNLIGYDAEISHVVILMGITYMISVLIINNKYK